MNIRNLVSSLVVVLVLASPALAADANTLPDPIRRAVDLLRLSSDQVPPIVVVDKRPPELEAINPNAYAWVELDQEGNPIPPIYVLSTTPIYRGAKDQDYQSLVLLAGSLAHEREHLLSGSIDDEQPYATQLAVMEMLRASDKSISIIQRSLQYVRALKKKAAATTQVRASN